MQISIGKLLTCLLLCSQIVRAFEFVGESDLSNGMKVGQSNLFYSAQQSAEIRLFQRMAFGSQDYSTDFSETSWRDEREL